MISIEELGERFVKSIDNILRGPEFKINMEFKNNNIISEQIEGESASLLTAICVIANKIKQQDDKLSNKTIFSSLINCLECSEKDLLEAYHEYKELTSIIGRKEK